MRSPSGEYRIFFYIFFNGDFKNFKPSKNYNYSIPFAGLSFLILINLNLKSYIRIII